MGVGQRICLRRTVVSAAWRDGGPRGTASPFAATVPLSRSLRRMPDEYSPYTWKITCVMSSPFYDNSSTKWKQTHSPQCSTRGPSGSRVGAPTGRGNLGALQMYGDAHATAGLETENCYQHAEHYYRVMRKNNSQPRKNKRSRQNGAPKYIPRLPPPLRWQ